MNQKGTRPCGNSTAGRGSHFGEADIADLAFPSTIGHGLRLMAVSEALKGVFAGELADFRGIGGIHARAAMINAGIPTKVIARRML
jgi:hypothetical protein